MFEIRFLSTVQEDSGQKSILANNAKIYWIEGADKTLCSGVRLISLKFSEKNPVVMGEMVVVPGLPWVESFQKSYPYVVVTV